MLPPVFAVYRHDCETFQFFASELDKEGNLVRIKNWWRPDADAIRSNPLLFLWANGGQEWYVVPTYSQGSDEPPKTHNFNLNGKSYSWWSLRHCLVWSDYLTHACRNSTSREKWMRSPRIPILECSSKLIYPRTVIETYPRWCDSSPKKVEMESQRGLTYSKKQPDVPVTLDIEDDIDPKDLRIRTPPPRDEEEGSPTSDLRAQHYAPRARGWSKLAYDFDDELDFATMTPSVCGDGCVKGLVGFMTTFFCVSTLLLLV